MTLYDHIQFAMFGIWVACFLLDVVIVALSLLYGNIQLNRKYNSIPTTIHWTMYNVQCTLKYLKK